MGWKFVKLKYKSDDPRYDAVINYIRDKLLPDIINMRIVFAKYLKKGRDREKQERQKKDEEKLREKVDEYKIVASEKATEKITDVLGDKSSEDIKEIIKHEINEFLPIIGLKRKVDSQKKKILISQVEKDKSLSDIIYKMLSFNGVPDDDILYTNCDNEDCWIPTRTDIFEYLRQFFIDSYSVEKMFVIYVTSDDMEKSWGAVLEAGAGWITRSDSGIFNINGYRPKPPLDTSVEWHTSKKNGDDIIMSRVDFGKFIVKILDICSSLGYKVRSKGSNKKELNKYVQIDG